jgi:small subunit ribosomal protein S8
MTDPIADFLTRIRNGCNARLPEVIAPYSKMKGEISRILMEEGYIWGYEVDTKSSQHPELKLRLKYHNRVPVIRNLKRVSKPGLRNYVGANEIPRVLGGLGISIISTSKGLLTGAKARKQRAGGEFLATVW